MNEELSQEEISNKTNDKPWLFKKGNPGGPGRTPGKSLKEYSREYLAKMTEEERLNFLEGLPKVDIWKMAEGNPKNDIEHSGSLTISQVLDELENGSKISEQKLEDKQSI